MNQKMIGIRCNNTTAEGTITCGATRQVMPRVALKYLITLLMNGGLVANIKNHSDQSSVSVNMTSSANIKTMIFAGERNMMFIVENLAFYHALMFRDRKMIKALRISRGCLDPFFEIDPSKASIEIAAIMLLDSFDEKDLIVAAHTPVKDLIAAIQAVHDKKYASLKEALSHNQE